MEIVPTHLDKPCAEEAQGFALSAMENLSRLLLVYQRAAPEPEFLATRRTVGLIFGKIQMELLEPIYATFPELDHLADSTPDK
jgi:hypothetical protein